MKNEILIVEDELVIAYDLQLTLEEAGYVVCGVANSVAEAMELIGQRRPYLVLLDIYLKGDLSGIDLAHWLNKENIGFVYLSANSNQKVLEEAKTTQPYGFLVKPFRKKDLLVALDIAKYRYEYKLEAEMRREAELKKHLEDILCEPEGRHEKLLRIASLLQSYIPFDYLTIGVTRAGYQTFVGWSFLKKGYDEYESITPAEFNRLTDITPDKIIEYQQNTPAQVTLAYFNDQDFEEICRLYPLKKLIAHTFGMKSNLVMPLDLSNESLVFSYFSRNPTAYNPSYLDFLKRMQPALMIAIDKILLAEDKEQPAEQPLDEPQQKEILERFPNFHGVIGGSIPLTEVFDQIKQVARLDTCVLIQGDTGTGKERIAHIIHKLSARIKKPMVIINCAALADPLIAVELFGYEKEGFGGITESRPGKIESAHGGTLFLDEIGAMPPELQEQMVRILQEKKIQRIGSRISIPIDIRIIASTNHNLEKEIASGRFRHDFYYRLTVYSIIMPSLAARGDDILLLANYFSQINCRRFNKPFHGISDSMAKELLAYSWPGNIRELQNIIEHSVILSNGRYQLELKRKLES